MRATSSKTARPAAIGAGIIFTLGATGQSVFSLYRKGQLWTGGRKSGTTTPVLYLPTVAGIWVRPWLIPTASSS